MIWTNWFRQKHNKYLEMAFPLRHNPQQRTEKQKKKKKNVERTYEIQIDCQ